MADNVEITAGSGTPIRTDDVGSGVQVQYVKLMDGTDGSSAVISGDATNGLDVDVTRFPQSALTTLQNAATATGNGVTLDVTGMGTVVAQITGTYSAAVTFEGSPDGTNWQTVPMAYVSAGTVNALLTATSSNGTYVGNCSGLVNFRARISTYFSGSVTVKAVASGAAAPQPIQPALPVGADGSALAFTVASDSLFASTGVFGYSNLLAYNGGTHDRVRTVGAGDAAGTGILAGGNYVYNGSTWDRARSVAAGDAASTGILASGNYVFNGSTWDRQRVVAHDAAATGASSVNPLLMGGYASAAAPTDVSGDGDAVRAWHLRNGAAATVITAGGALIGGDATNGLDVDVTRLPALASGTNNIGDVDVLTVPSDPFGANADAASATGSISAKLRYMASTGIPVFDTDSELSLATGHTGLRDFLVAQRRTVLADSLADGLAGFWTSTTANGGTATSTGGEGVVQTSANASGSAMISSTAVAYYPGQVAWFNSAARFGDTGGSSNTRRIGVFTVSGTTPQNGFYYELSDTTFNAVVVNGGSATSVASGSWSKFSTAPFTLDTNYHSFEIRFTANSAWFYIDNVLRHVHSGTSAAITATLNFPITISSINTSGATNRLIAVRNCGVGAFGQPGQIVNETGLSAVQAQAVGGGTPHDSVDSGNPIKLGMRALAHGSNPSAVAAGDRTDWLANRAGVPWVIGGHPNIVTNSVRLTGSNTDTAIIAGTINAGTKVVVTRLSVTVSNATTVNVGCKVGFGASTLAADSTTSAVGILIDSDGFPPGGGINIGDGSGIIGIGADGEELRITNDAPTSGAIHVTVSYYTIES